MPGRRQNLRTSDASRSRTQRTDFGTPDQTERGRGMFRLLQRRRAGTPEHEGRREPVPRREGHLGPERREPLPSERGASRGRRIAWSLGALTAAGAGTFWWMRRRARDRGRRGTMRRY